MQHLLGVRKGHHTETAEPRLRFHFLNQHLSSRQRLDMQKNSAKAVEGNPRGSDCGPPQQIDPSNLNGSENAPSTRTSNSSTTVSSANKTSHMHSILLWGATSRLCGRLSELKLAHDLYQSFDCICRSKSLALERLLHTHVLPIMLSQFECRRTTPPPLKNIPKSITARQPKPLGPTSKTLHPRNSPMLPGGRRSITITKSYRD